MIDMQNNTSRAHVIAKLREYTYDPLAKQCVWCQYNVAQLPSWKGLSGQRTSQITWSACCRVSRLYQHVFPPNVAPTLSFVGLPWKVVPFAQYELQAKWISRVLSGRAKLPSKQEMNDQIDQFYQNLEQEGVPRR
jgi:hypothetical protein